MIRRSPSKFAADFQKTQKAEEEETEPFSIEEVSADIFPDTSDRVGFVK